MMALCFGTRTDRRNQLVVVAWLFAWAISFVAAKWTLKSGEAIPLALQLAAVAVPTILAIGGVLAFLKFLREADELVRRIELEAWESDLVPAYFSG